MPHDAFIQNRSPLSATAPRGRAFCASPPELALPRRTAPHGCTPANTSLTVRITDRESRAPRGQRRWPCALPPCPGWPGRALPSRAPWCGRAGAERLVGRSCTKAMPDPATPGPGTGARLFRGFPMLVPPGPATRGRALRDGTVPVIPAGLGVRTPAPRRRHGPWRTGEPEGAGETGETGEAEGPEHRRGAGNGRRHPAQRGRPARMRRAGVWAGPGVYWGVLPNRRGVSVCP